jgi:HD-GYP domain-containing protein (c-di-GMP phosphodiesterase class II)
MHLSELISALSYALDMTEGQPPGHSLRCAWIGMHVGRRLGLAPERLSDLYYALLLKDAGCSSNAARLWELYGGDERLVKHNYKTVDSQSLRALAHFVLKHTAPGEGLRKRVERIMDVVRNGGDYANEVIQTRCERGADIVRRLGFGEPVAAGVHALDEHWNGRGRPLALKGDAIPLTARIALLAQVVDVFHAVSGPSGAMAEVRRRSASWFDPAVVEAFHLAARLQDFWAGLSQDGLAERVAALEPVARIMVVDEDRLDVITEAFADVVDAKSRFTAGHSRRVMGYADGIAAGLGLSPARRRWLRRGALLHDIGKLGVGTGILDKPAPLSPPEWATMKRHAEYGEEILSRMSTFRDLAPIAGGHHEKLDGSGYPRGLKGDAIPLEIRIVTTADIFDALTAKRPYREPMPIPEALAMMERDRDTAIDGRCLDALRSAIAPVGEYAA